MATIEGMSFETLCKFVEGMTITSVVEYVNPQAIHLFIADMPRGRPSGLLTLTAQDDGVLIVRLEGFGRTSDDF